MAKRLYVGNLPFSMTDRGLQELFSQCGRVIAARVITDRTGRSKGFGFVEMSAEAEAKAAIGKLDGFELNGRPISVSEPFSPATPDRQ